ncbi:Type 1 glutamine amidotransferase-like domain-containing protein [Legionella sp. WA2022007384]
MTHMLLMSFDDSNFITLNRTLNRFMEYAFGLIKKSDIHFCYIGTAGNDRLIERVFFSRFVRAKFGKSVITSELVLTKSQSTKEQLENYLTQQDILFIGGGNTEKMLEIWEKSGFSFVLNKLKSENRLPLLAGVSAGGMYPFHSGLSDSIPGQYNAMSCLGWFKESFCPHANSKRKSLCVYSNNQYLERMDAYINAVRQGLLPSGFAVPDDCMLHFENFNLVHVISSLKENKCYYVTHATVTDLETVCTVNASDPNIRLECWSTLFKYIDYFKQYAAKLQMKNQ